MTAVGAGLFDLLLFVLSVQGVLTLDNRGAKASVGVHWKTFFATFAFSSILDFAHSIFDRLHYDADGKQVHYGMLTTTNEASSSLLHSLGVCALALGCIGCFQYDPPKEWQLGVYAAALLGWLYCAFTGSHVGNWFLYILYGGATAYSFVVALSTEYSEKNPGSGYLLLGLVFFWGCTRMAAWFPVLPDYLDQSDYRSFLLAVSVRFFSNAALQRPETLSEHIKKHKIDGGHFA